MLFDKSSPLHQRIAHYVLPLQNQHVENEKVQRRARRAIVLQAVERWPADFIQSATTSPSMTVSSGMSARALTMPGYRPLKSLLLRDRRCTLPRVFIAKARYPSSFSSYSHSGPSSSRSLFQK